MKKFVAICSVNIRSMLYPMSMAIPMTIYVCSTLFSRKRTILHHVYTEDHSFTFTNLHILFHSPFCKHRHISNFSSHFQLNLNVNLYSLLIFWRCCCCCCCIFYSYSQIFVSVSMLNMFHVSRAPTVSFESRFNKWDCEFALCSVRSHWKMRKFFSMYNILCAGFRCDAI